MKNPKIKIVVKSGDCRFNFDCDSFDVSVDGGALIIVSEEKTVAEFKVWDWWVTK